MLWKVRVYESRSMMLYRVFLAMKILDGDEQRLTFQGQEAERDIVQVYSTGFYYLRTSTSFLLIIRWPYTDTSFI